MHDVYKKGTSICLAGQFGLGKTMLVTNVLKKAVAKNYSGLYVSLGDIVSSMKSGESYTARKELLNTDFLVIDEFDPRYMATDAASDFYGRVLEDILRNRSQNKLPIFMCTNSPNPVGAFNGSIHESMSSLMNYVKIIPVLGKDYREKEGNNV
jgi:DNA replication protein DnaC